MLTKGQVAEAAKGELIRINAHQEQAAIRDRSRFSLGGRLNTCVTNPLGSFSDGFWPSEPDANESSFVSWVLAFFAPLWKLFWPTPWGRT